MKMLPRTFALCALGTLLGCAEEPPPPTVDEFLADSVLLEATMMRCAANRSSTKYEPECINAREAINRIARTEEAERRAQLEEQSERKRRALRRTQEAASAARRHAAEAQRRREEAAYLSQFDAPLDASEGGPSPDTTVTEHDTGALPEAGTTTVEPQPNPVPQEQPETSPPASGDLDAIREELRRRQDGSQ